jgi:toxin ParE1/3/4
VKARNIRFHPEARAELRAAVEFYEQQASGLGRDLVGEVRVVLERLGEWPQSGAPEEDEVRRAILARFPFTVVYTVGTDSIDIIAVMHQRQRPGYWRGRA